MKYRQLNIILLTLILFSCNRFEFSHYQIKPDEENINKKNVELILKSETDTVKIAVIGDSQRFYTSTSETVKKINNTPDINFVIHTGDLVDFGLQKEYNWIHELLSKLNYPYVAVVGNHDLIGNGGDIYKLMYGEFNFSFRYAGNKFIFLNTNAREFGFDLQVPNISWLDSQLSDTSNYNQAIIVNHVPAGNVDFNSHLEDEYIETLRKYKKVILSINGHNHAFAYSEPYNDGIPYLNSYSTSTQKFVLLKIWDGDFSIETIN